ncbi:L-type lectin-domain containing receptor kinase VIII.1-like [Zingiber officinale]|uniref:L-type lectin-domain containing receptor kinase VIII.1-like n=1 Tax=Zingiber officinale TaxID=94328 RepID=UPI001C4DB537|nr:L-type lectin-domain containing receptor kinase VIII.1-like [Zingiber officinale]
MTTSSTASALILAIILLLVAPLSPGNCASTGEGNTLFFSFGGSGKKRSFATEFALYGNAEMNSSEVRVTRAANESSGLMIYWKPVRFFGTKPGFSSSFSFSVSPFFLSLVSVPLEPANGDWSRSSTSVVAVKFVTAASLVEVDVGGELLTKSSNLSGDGLLLILSRGEKLHSWIDYDGESKRIEVKLYQDKDPKEAAPSISHSIDLSYMLWREASWVGLSSWSGNSSHGSSIYLWNFTEKSKLCTYTIPVYSALMLSSFRHSYD